MNNLRKYWYMMIDRDYYELPMAVADSVYELAEITGYKQSTISHEVHYSGSKFIKVRKDEKDTTDYSEYDSADLDIESERNSE